MSLTPEQAAFAARLGHEFARPELLERALTHASAASPAHPDNERLEFLGDRLLGLIIAEALFEADTEAAEGTLAPRLNALVRRETCAEVAREIALGQVLRLGRSETMTGGRRKMALLANAMEAVIAAIHLDGGLDAARPVVLRLWAGRLERAGETGRDAKTALQEWAQARGEPPPAYHETAREGPDHAPVFTVAVALAGGPAAEARARTKREAEQKAAAALLAQIERE